MQLIDWALSRRRGNSMNRIPNIITMMRGGLAVLAIALVTLDIPHLYQALLTVFILGAATDYADGVIARSYNLVSDFGKVFDPLFDKVLVFVFLVILYPTGTIPEVVVLLIIVRDLVVDALRSSYAEKGVVIPAIWSAKAKTALAFAAIVSALVELSFDTSVIVGTVTDGLSYAALLLAYTSAALYGVIFLTNEKKLKNQPTDSSKI